MIPAQTGTLEGLKHRSLSERRVRACNRFTLLPLNPAGNPAIVSRYEPGIINRANVFQPLRTCESRLRLTLAATQIKSAPALSRSGSLSVYSILLDDLNDAACARIDQHVVAR